MRKRLTALLLCCLLAASLAGCAAPPDHGRITVVASIFPEYDWARQIIGPDSDIELRLLVDDGVDPHSFQPTVGDMVTVARCDLLIFGGGESDEWLGEVLEESPKAGRQVVELLPLLGQRAHTAEAVEGMQVREDEAETDEHVWLSPKNAALFCTEIARSLCQIDPANAETYRKNLNDYLLKLDELDSRYQETVANGAKNTILVCDRFPFRYLVEDYSLQYYAAFPGCSAESGASFATVVFLADRVKELELNAVLVLEGSDRRIARTVAENSGRAGVKILTLDSMQTVSLAGAAERDYLTIMEQNRQVLEQALG